MRNLRLVALALAAGVVGLAGATFAVPAGAISMVPAAPGDEASGVTSNFWSTASGVLEGEGGQYDQPWWDAIHTAVLSDTASTLPWGPDQVQWVSATDTDQAREDLANGAADFATAEGP